jgi:hypothetical protein
MNEARITAELLHFLRTKTRGLIIKHADQSTIGIPDISITCGHETLWLEVKLIKYKRVKPMELRKIVGFPGPQARTVSLLDFHGSGCGYAIFFTNGEEWHLYLQDGVEMANLCNQNRTITPGKDMLYSKSFEQVWDWIIKRRKFKEESL